MGDGMKLSAFFWSLTIDQRLGVCVLGAVAVVILWDLVKVNLHDQREESRGRK